jgi:uncharacterized protein (TIGR03435 family)
MRFETRLALGMIIYLTPVVYSQNAQSGSTQQNQLAYEVASVKQYQADGDPNVYIRSDSRSFSANVPLTMLVHYAFGALVADQIQGEPPWTRDVQYTIDAKIDKDTTARLDQLPDVQRQQELHKMIQNLLVDRFGLQFHHAEREIRVYSLVIAKGGLKMKKSLEESQTSYEMGHDHLRAAGIDFTNLVRSLCHITGMLVINDTGLSGRYDVSLSWSPDLDQDSDENGASVFTALQEQLGLKLESKKEPIDVVVIDHIEAPSRN